MQSNQEEQTGRRGLFSINPKEPKPIQSEYQKNELQSILSTILSYENGDFPPLPELFHPILERLKHDTLLLQEKTRENDELSSEFNKILEEQSTIKKEHETYLSDLISAHTEFDRALEIFQYHSIPMILIGSEFQILDANDIFCSIFSVERSLITHEFPPFSRYVPDEKSFKSPDGKTYSTISLNPPIVPFDHDAISLKLLIETPEEEKDTEDLYSEIFKTILERIFVPIAIIDEYSTIQFVNDALLSLLSREHPEVYLRDIASCGFAPDIVTIINDVKESDQGNEFQTVITHQNNEEIKIWIQVSPLRIEDKSHLLLQVFPDEEESETEIERDVDVDLKEIKEKPSSEPLSPIEISNTYLKTLIDFNPSPIILFDKYYTIVLANEGFSELIGVSTDQLIGQNISDIGLKIPTNIDFHDQITVLSNEIRIESPFGMLAYSGLIISNNSEEAGYHILILQSSGDETPSQETKKEIVKPVSQIQNIEKIPEPKPTLHHDISIEIIPIPVIEYDGTNVTRINNAFCEWTGLTLESITDYLPGIISQTSQGSLDSNRIFSSDFPTGSRHYQLVSVPHPDHAEFRIIWFIDNTTAQGKVSELETKLSEFKNEIAQIREKLTDKNSGEIQLSDEISKEIDIVEFELSGNRYAMDIGMVREVVEMLPITPLPKTPPHVIGIINLRGEVTHVIDLGILLGEGMKKDRTGQKIIVVPSDAAHGEHLGIIVDNVRSVTEIAYKQVTALGDEINTRIQTRIKGIIKVKHDDVIDKREGTEKGDNLVIWLDMKEILTGLAGFR